MKRIAVIGFYHTEMSLCLSKYMAMQGTEVDYYCVCDLLRDKGYQSGYEYFKASKRLGITTVTEKGAPEIIADTRGLSINHYLLRILSFSNKLWFVNKLILKKAFKKIRAKRYDAIDIIGQNHMLKFFHEELKTENITHTFHEIGSHQDGIVSTPLIQTVINDKTKVILPSTSTYSRFVCLPGVDKNRVSICPVGEHLSLLLYERDVDIELNIDISKPTFLFYGYIKPYKGLPFLAEAMRFLQGQFDRFNLIVAGAGTDDALPYFQALENCQVINRFLSNDEIVKLNRICDVVLLPYKTASQSGIVLTSFMYGKPIIGTKVGALVETIKDGHNGLLVDNDNPKEFADAMMKIIDNRDFASNLVKGALEFGHGDDYDWNIIAQQTIKFLME